VFEALLNLMSRALEGLNSLPWGIHAAVALAMVAGLVLWLAGQRVLKPMMVAGVALLGATIGGLIVPSTSWGAELTVWHGLGAGLIAGTILGLLVYRSAMALGFGVVLGAALPLIAASVLQFYPISGQADEAAWAPAEEAWQQVTALGDRAPEASEVGAWSGGIRVLGVSWMDDAENAAQAVERELAEEPSVPANLAPTAERISTAWSTATSEVRSQWETLPRPHQAVVGLAGVIGLAGGVIAGLSMPAWASAMVTALFGAAIWLPAFVWLSNAMGAPWRAQFDRSPAAWLAIWAAVALVGMVVQWSGVLKKKPAAKPKAAPAAA
jgi:hypothetical protein